MLEFTVEGQQLKQTNSVTIVADSSDYLTTAFTFSADWEGLDKTLYFKESGSEDPYTIQLNEENKTSGTDHFNLTEGSWDIYLRGELENKAITTNVIQIDVKPSGLFEGEPAPTKPPSIVATLIQNVETLITNVATLLGIIKSDGDGKKALFNNGTYIEVIPEIGSLADKATPTDTDEIAISDKSTITGDVTVAVPKKLTLLNLYNYLKAKFDLIYTGGGTSYSLPEATESVLGGTYSTAMVKNNYKGKKGVWFGDSIIDLFSIPQTVAPMLGATIVNAGFQACCMAPKYTTTDGQQYFSMLELAKAISTGTWTNQNTYAVSPGALTALYNHLQALKAVDFTTVDFVLISYGTNDFGYNAPIGDCTCMDSESTCGALNNAINYIEGKNSNIEIIVTTPIWRGKPAPDDTGFEKTNRLEDYVYAIKQTCGARGIKCIDLFTRSGINTYNKATMLNNTDILHPLTPGVAAIANAVVACINNGYVGTTKPYSFWDKDPLNLIFDHDSLWEHYCMNLAYVYGGIKYLTPALTQQYKDAILSRKYYASIASGAVISASTYFVCFNAGSGTIGRIDISIVSKADGTVLQTTTLACAFTATEVLKTATALTTTGAYTNCYVELHVKRMVSKSVTDFGVREPVIKITGA